MASVRELWTQRDALKQTIASLEAQIKEIDVALFGSIPANERVDGVKHVVCSNTSVKYKDWLNEVISKFVPKTKQDSALLVSWDSLERRRIEYQDLVQKKIPANSKEIAIARSYGDLRENHEFKAAKEMQKVLMRQKQELEGQLMRARGTDFSNTTTEAVAIGSVVLATDLGTNQPETFTILGAWDSDPDKGIISYLSPVGAALLNHKPGEEVEFEFHGAKHRHRIEKIEAWKSESPAASLAAPVEAHPQV